MPKIKRRSGKEASFFNVEKFTTQLQESYDVKIEKIEAWLRSKRMEEEEIGILIARTIEGHSFDHIRVSQGYTSNASAARYHRLALEKLRRIVKRAKT